MKSWRLETEDGGWRLPIANCDVNCCLVDYAFSLRFFEDNQTAVVRIEGDFTIFGHELTHRLDPSVPRDLGPALSLFGQVVRSASASTEGRLEIAFVDGRILSVEPDDMYEAWQITGPGGMLVVCIPSGGLAIWQPRDLPQSE
jgi:hypothetical protein